MKSQSVDIKNERYMELYFPLACGVDYAIQGGSNF